MDDMKCVVLGEIGKDLSKSLLLETRPCPVVDEAVEVLLEVLAVGVNPSDFKATVGAFPYAFPGNICGRDCCGRVVKGPPDLLGKVVWSSGGKERGLCGDGGLAQYTKLPLGACLPLPRGVGIAEAGAMGVPLCTAAVVMSKLQVQRGDTVAITGANGQVARYVLGLAQWKGAKTVAIIRRDLSVPNANHTIVGNVENDIVEKLRDLGPINAIVDTVGVGTEHLVEAASHKGRIVILSSQTPDASFPLLIKQFYRKDLTLHSTETMQYGAVESAEFIREVLPAFDCGNLKPPELHPEIFPLDQVRDAYELVSKGSSNRVLVAPNGVSALCDAKV